MKRILFYISAIIVGTLVGLTVFKSASDIASKSHGIVNGPWTTNEAYGDKNADPLLKSAVAVSALLALKASETIYFTATVDSQGKRLSDACAYFVEGQSPDSRWSSITLYGQDHFLIPNDHDHYSVFLPEPGSDFSFVVAPERPDEGTWLASLGGGKLSLTLRIYNPAPIVYENLATVALPTITRGECK